LNFAGKTYLPRGLRDNNPLNVNSDGWKGEISSDGQEAVFSDTVYGLRAAAIVLFNYFTLYGLDNLNDIIGRYAPASDGNDVAGYVSYVSKKTGWGATDSISLTGDNLIKLMKAMTGEEIGNDYVSMIPDSEYIAAIKLTEKDALVNTLTIGGSLFLIVLLILILYKYAKGR
jgi:hypothetical protein